MKVIWVLAGALSLADDAMPVERSKPRDVTVVTPDPVKKEEPLRSRRAGVSKTTLGKGIEIALLKVPGEALSAEIEVEGRKAVIEVRVFAKGKVFAVEIDGETGRVLKVEPDDDDDDEEDDEGEEEGEATKNRRRR